MRDYSRAVQERSESWSELNKVWEELAKVESPEDFGTTLSLHGIKKLRDYIDGVDRITTPNLELQKAHNELVSSYRKLDELLTGFVDRVDVYFREDPEGAREKARKELVKIFDHTRQQETNYLKEVGRIYQEHGLRLGSNLSNRYEEGHTETPEEIPTGESGKEGE